MQVLRADHTYEPHGLYSPVQNDLVEAQNLQIAVVLLPDFSCLSYQALIEPFSFLNNSTTTHFVQRSLYSLDGKPVRSSDGSVMEVDGCIDDVSTEDMVILCGGHHIVDHGLDDLLSWLRRPLVRVKKIGALESACLPLMKSGLLDGYKCSVHWRFLGSAQELYPHLDIQQGLYEIDRNRFTSAGGVAVLDLVLALIKQFGGDKISRQVSAHYYHDQDKVGFEVQKKHQSFGIVAGNERLNRAIEYIQSNLEEQINCLVLAEKSGMSRRQLERQFRRYLGVTPIVYVSHLRLLRAVDLLLGTAMSITEIAFACGFNSSTHFSKRFKDHYGERPKDVRMSKTIPVMLI